MNKIINLGEAASIRVLSTPERELVRAALTPELLRANYRSAFELKRGAPNWKDFERSIGRTTLQQGGERGDHRWAILFRDARDRIKHVVAIDRKRRLANVDGKPYSIRGDILGWLIDQQKLLAPHQ